MLKRIISCLFLLLVLSSCARSNPDVDMAYAIMGKHAEYMQREHNARVFGIGGGFPDKITELGMCFNVQAPMDIPTARKLLVVSTQHLLNLVNSNEKIRPYLANYPFTSKNLRYSFYVNDEEGNMISQKGRIDPNNLSCFRISKEDILYCVEIDKYKPLVDIKREPYFEAVSIVQYKNEIKN